MSGAQIPRVLSGEHAENQPQTPNRRNPMKPYPIPPLTLDDILAGALLFLAGQLLAAATQPHPLLDYVVTIP